MAIAARIRRLFRRDHPVGWQISAPFLFTLDLRDEGAAPPLDFSVWRTILCRIARHATDVFFIEGSDDVLPLLELSDGLGFRIHLITDGKWGDARLFVNRLRALRHLATLRMAAGETAMLKLAVDAGLDVWAVVTADAVTREFAENLHALGVKGVAVARSNGAAGYEIARQLRQDGYRIMLEECAPIALAGRCRGGLASCFVDAQGQVKSCRHSTAILGSLVTSDIAAIWSSPEAENLRGRFAGQQGTLASLYRHGCRFEGEVEHDPPMPAASPAIRLDPSLVPVPRFALRPEPFGAVLIKDFDFLPLSHSGAEIVRAFDGKTNLASLERRFGKAATLLAYALFCEKMLRFARDAAEPPR